jgi:hypothetical protein
LGRELKNDSQERKRISEQNIANENTNLRIQKILSNLNESGYSEVRPHSPSQQEIFKIYESYALSTLDKNGYKINLYTASYYAYTDVSFLPDYVSNVATATEYDVAEKPLLSLSMMQMALYRCFPLMFKHYLGNINSSTCNNYVLCEGDSGFSQYTTDMEDAFAKIKDKKFKTTDEKIFSFIHIDGCHDAAYDENCNKVSRGGSTMKSLKSSFKIINEYIKEMKRLGIYKNATIIITGYHGSPEGNASDLNNPTLTALLFKQSGSDTGALKFNTAQVSHDDIWVTIFESEKLTHSLDKKSLFEINQNENRTRKYFWHNYTSPMKEQIYNISGAGKDLKNWKLDSSKTYNKFVMD